MERTADNFNINAEEDDGTCIPARRKLIGTYGYTNVWTDVVSGTDTFAFGTIQFTEANTAKNAFNANLDGQLILQGSISANDLILENHVQGTSTYYGNGIWLRSDSVNLVLNVTLNSTTLPTPQLYRFYCTKRP